MLRWRRNLVRPFYFNRSKLVSQYIKFLDSRKYVKDLERESGYPLEDLARRFLQDQKYPHPELNSADLPLNECPAIDDKLSVYRSARATWYAPSELAGPTGMHMEIIRSTPSWFRRHERRDTVLIQNGSDEDVMKGMVVGRVMMLLGVPHDDDEYPCALVEWMLPVGNQPDEETGMWVVEPEKVGHKRNVGLIHLDCIARSCHLIGVSRGQLLPKDFKFWQSHAAFKSFYVNRYSDYHMHETGP